jgi:hypothetical protein
MRDHLVEQKQWTRAAELYVELTRTGPKVDGDAWFERAAVQLATTWLDTVSKLPSARAQMHRHNWLEANILRKEAEGLLSLPTAK